MQAVAQIAMVVRMSQPDFIQITDNAVSREDCAAIVQRMRDSQQLHPGRIGGGVFPELKHSRDLRISGVAEWAAVENRLQHAVFEGVLTYLRHYPQA
ncbi:hypothetical protein XPN_3201 [Xanthomonas arboricola pv. pruni MAFF 301427]|nr:hypothetical protein XPN_3201 [Xanthomonas arboricola pv. pruni MAFF 301427]